MTRRAVRTRTRIATLAICWFMLVPPSARSAEAPPGTIHEERSLYRNIYIVDNGDKRCMAFRVREGAIRVHQSCKWMSRPDEIVYDYPKMMLAGLYLNPHPRRILIIGQGGGILTTALQDMLPETEIDVVEIDEAVNRMAAEYFSFRPGKNTHVTISDGRVFVKRAAARKIAPYDMVLLDSFADDYIPEHMLTREFFEEIKAIMTPNGVIVGNTFCSSALYDHESVTYRAVFGTFFNLKLKNSRIVLGRIGGLPALDEIKRNAQTWEAAFNKRGSGSAFLLPLLKTDLDWFPAARILTDQYSPSNLLNSRPRF